MRAIVRSLEERALLDLRPGRTADEAAAEAGRSLPAPRGPTARRRPGLRRRHVRRPDRDRAGVPAHRRTRPRPGARQAATREQRRPARPPTPAREPPNDHRGHAPVHLGLAHRPPGLDPRARPRCSPSSSCSSAAVAIAASAPTTSTATSTPAPPTPTAAAPSPNSSPTAASTTRVVTTTGRRPRRGRPRHHPPGRRPRPAHRTASRRRLRSATAGSGGRTVLVAPGSRRPSDASPPASPRTPRASLDSTLAPDCDLPAARRAGPADTGRHPLHHAPPPGRRLLPQRRPAHPAARPAPPGDGGDTVVLGAPDILYNDRLDEQGNASLALQLLGSRPHLVWYLPSLSDAVGRRRRTTTQLPRPAPLRLALGHPATLRRRRSSPPSGAPAASAPWSPRRSPSPSAPPRPPKAAPASTARPTPATAPPPPCAPPPAPASPPSSASPPPRRTRPRPCSPPCPPASTDHGDRTDACTPSSSARRPATTRPSSPSPTNSTPSKERYAVHDGPDH